MHWILDLIQGVYHFYTQSSIFSGSAGIGQLTGKQFHCQLSAALLLSKEKIWRWFQILNLNLFAFHWNSQYKEYSERSND